jgi:hypothetical protein
MERDQHELETFYAAARDECPRVVLIPALVYASPACTGS